jgi:hypothetical protein
MQLQEVIGEEIEECTMITLTVFQRQITFESAMRKLIKSYTLLRKVLTKHYGAIDFFYVLEPHKTGYPHMHLLYCKILTAKEKLHIRRLWCELYHAADKQYGIHFSEARRSVNGDFEAGTIKKVKSYLMKYLVKGLYQESMSPAELVFNATLKKTKTRLWNCSRHFSKIMSRKNSPSYVPPNPDWECLEVFKQDSKKPDENELIWSKDGGLRPDPHKPVWELQETKSLTITELIKYVKNKYEYLIKTVPIYSLDKHGVSKVYAEEYQIYKKKWVKR